MRMRITWTWMVAPWLAAACGDDGGSMMDATTLAASSGDEASAGSTLATTSASTSGSSSDGADDASTGAPGDTGVDPGTILVRTTFVIPADTTVEEFSFSAPVQAPTVLSGESVVVAVRDLTHPTRDQSVLCPSSHPLDGCATIDYGAFGTTHDNRVSFEGPGGPWSIHLYKDRTLELDPEMLAFNE